eukprot:185493-Prorocentrum_minimum.AAC.2
MSEGSRRGSRGGKQYLQQGPDVLLHALHDPVVGGVQRGSIGGLEGVSNTCSRGPMCSCMLRMTPLSVGSTFPSGHAHRPEASFSGHTAHVSQSLSISAGR